MQSVVRSLPDRVKGEVDFLQLTQQSQLSGVAVQLLDSVEGYREDLQIGGQVVQLGDLVVVHKHLLDVVVVLVVEEGQLCEVAVLQGDLVQSLQTVQVY